MIAEIALAGSNWFPCMEPTWLHYFITAVHRWSVHQLHAGDVLADAESTTLYMWLGLIGWILSSTEIPTLYVLSSQAGLHAHGRSL